ncbi:MAG: flagellin, partial [Thermotogaceae bacterium]|nr:flagellin [Thermotogaceae bacterium]
GDVSGNHGGYDYWIVKLNSDGTLDWEKSLGGSDYDGASSIQQTTDGGYIVAGRSKSNDGDVSENSDNDSWIVKLSNKQTYTEEFTEWEEVTSTEEYTEVRTIYHTLENSMGITEPTELIVYQGENIVKVTINPSDNFETLVQKLNQVIAEDLNQGKYVDNTSKFVTFADGTEATSEALYRMETGDDGVQKKFSTVLIRTVIPGEIGRIHISGDEKILNALGFSSIQKAKDSTFLLDATDAHSGKVVQKKTFVKGNSMESFLGSPVGLRFNPMAGIEATWDESTKKFSFSSAADSYRTNLHLVSTGMKVHTGSNQKDDLEITIGDMSAKGINLIPPRLCVFTRELAEQAIEKADKAIGNVSSERSKIGALQNRLEKSINVAENAVENLVTAESRIRDADMAKQTMIMTKQQMLMQVRGMMGS